MLIRGFLHIHLNFEIWFLLNIFPRSRLPLTQATFFFPSIFSLYHMHLIFSIVALPTAISHLALCFCLIPKSQFIILLKFVQSCSFSVLYPKKKKKLNKKTGIFSVDELITNSDLLSVYIYI